MTTLLDLIKAGFINDGDILYWEQPRLGMFHRAVIKRDGKLLTSDGIEHRSLSGAARHFYKKPIDGWSNWRLEKTGESLSEIRKKALEKN